MFASHEQCAQASKRVHKTSAILFYLHSSLALYILFNFPEVLHIFFRTTGEESDNHPPACTIDSFCDFFFINFFVPEQEPFIEAVETGTLSVGDLEHGK